MDKALGIIVSMASEALCLMTKPLSLGEVIRLPEGPIVCLSGVGRKRAQRAADHVLRQGAKALLSWGSAGGLVRGLRPGKLLVPESILALDQSQFSADPEWHDRLWHRLEGHVDLNRKPLAETRGALLRAEDKRVLSLRTGAVAADMESAAIARMAHRAGARFLAIRAVSDGVDATLPFRVLAAFDREGQLDLRGIFKEVVKHPLELPAWIRFYWGVRSARTTLTKTAALAGNDFLVPRLSQTVLQKHG